MRSLPSLRLCLRRFNATPVTGAIAAAILHVMQSMGNTHCLVAAAKQVTFPGAMHLVTGFPCHLSFIGPSVRLSVTHVQLSNSLHSKRFVIPVVFYGMTNVVCVLV